VSGVGGGNFLLAAAWCEDLGTNAVSNAIGCAMHYSRSADAVIRAYDEAGNVIETHEHAYNDGNEVGH
jgi:hypothetical protein